MNLSPINAPRKRGNKPLRSALELCAEFGVTIAHLRGKLAAKGAPKPELRHRGKAYYEPAPFRAWWRKVQ